MSGTINGRHFTLEPTLSFSGGSVSTKKDTCTTTSTPDSSSTVCAPPSGTANKKARSNPTAFPWGQATGALGSMKVKARLTVDVLARTFGFARTIGTLHITGQFKVVDHDGKTETAHVTFDITT
jgi:hypothetical protein